jgi:hypothetical protein
MTDNVEVVQHIPYVGGSEVDSDGERYLSAGDANLTDDLDRQAVNLGEGGLRIIDLQGEVDPDTGEQVVEPYSVVGFLDCAGTDNYVRYLDPGVYNTEAGDREFIVMAFHSNRCTIGSPNAQPAGPQSRAGVHAQPRPADLHRPPGQGRGGRGRRPGVRAA